MSIPLIQQYRIGKYLLRQKLSGRKRYPLVLMLEPLFQCNLACAGCGKIDYKKDILKRRMSVADALQAVDDCGAPVVPKHIDEYQPSPYLTFSIHLDGLQRQHDASVCQEGVFDKAVAAIRLLRERKFRVTINCTLFAKENPDEVAEFFDFAMALGVEAITVSPGYHYEHAPRHDVFLGRADSKRLFREIFARGERKGRGWLFNHSSLYLDFLAGNQSYQCTPWSNPTYNVFGWQRPCYLMSDEGYAPSFRSLMEDTDWERYGVGRDPRYDNCMAHCGFEGTAVDDLLKHPLKALRVALRGPRLTGPMAPELPFIYEEQPAIPRTVVVPVSGVGRERRAREPSAAGID